MQRNRNGSVVLDKRERVWRFYWWESGKRKCKTLGRFATKQAAWSAAQTYRPTPARPKPPSFKATVENLVEAYRVERMPRRAMTRQGYNTWLNHYIIPVWGERSIQELQARPVDLWLQSLELAQKSKVHIRGLIRMLWDFSMWRGDVPLQRNPMELVTIRGASKRSKQPRSLTVEEFHKLLRELEEPFHMMALLCLCFGLRISECLALKWSDVDWLNGILRVERGIVHQIVDDVKTPESNQTMHIDPSMLQALKDWKQLTPFSDSGDWMFASPVLIGRKPISYAGVWQALKKAAERAAVGHLSSHTFRHTHRTWLDSLGTPVGIQQRLMRHSDIRMTMNVYGSAEAADMRDARGKIARLALTAGTNSREQ